MVEQDRVFRCKTSVATATTKGSNQDCLGHVDLVVSAQQAAFLSENRIFEIEFEGADRIPAMNASGFTDVGDR